MAERFSPNGLEARHYLALAGFLVLCLGLGFLAGLSSGPDDWYRALEKPGFQPPDSLFGPVWTILYILIAISGWLVWLTVGFSRVFIPYALQLALNFAWSFLFFTCHEIGLALADILLLAAAIVWTIAVFWQVQRIAAVILIPYFLWVGFATALNATIWSLN